MHATFVLRKAASWNGRGPSGKPYNFSNPAVKVVVGDPADISFFRANSERFKELLPDGKSVERTAPGRKPRSVEHFSTRPKATPNADSAEESQSNDLDFDDELDDEDLDEDFEDEDIEPEFEKRGSKYFCPECDGKSFKSLRGARSHYRQKHG